MAEAVSIKGTRSGLVIRLKPDASFDEITSGLTRLMQQGRDFFRGASFSFHWEGGSADFGRERELEGICRQYGMVPAEKGTTRVEVPAGSMATVLPFPAGERCDYGAAFFYSATLRSGQELERPGHIVVLGDVNPGGRVIAGGDVIVAGKVRGEVFAGCGGNRHSRVVAFSLQPTALVIAGVPATLPLPEGDYEEPVVAFIAAGGISITSLDEGYQTATGNKLKVSVS